MICKTNHNYIKIQIQIEKYITNTYASQYFQSLTIFQNASMYYLHQPKTLSSLKNENNLLDANHFGT